jgi:predicted short-subunit dehydrogenase-like oxidoreductase (DUF2520 family)
VLIAVPDDAIGSVAKRLAARSLDWSGRVVLHTSGNRTAEELAPLRARGAAVGSMHPLMTFVPDTVIAPSGLLFAIEGDAAALRAARSLVRHWRGHAVQIPVSAKANYHLAASFACPMVAIALAAAESALGASGLPATTERPVRNGLLRLAQQTVINAASGAAHAWTGPLARGDTQTTQSQLAGAGSIGLDDYYRAAARAALELLPVANREMLLNLIESVHPALAHR